MYYNTIDDALLGIGRLEKNKPILILAAEGGFDYSVLKRSAELSGIRYYGAVFPALIAEGRKNDTGYLVYQFEADSFGILVDSETPLEDELVRGNDYESCVVFMDALAENMQTLLNNINYVLPEVNFIGGGAGSLSLKQQPVLFDKDGLYQNKCLLYFIQKKLSVGVTHGYDRIAGPFIANKVSGNLLQEINWEPAYNIYKSIVEKDSGEELTPQGFFELAKKYPFGMTREGFEDIVRDPIAVTEQGYLQIIDEIPENTAIHFLKGKEESLIASAKKSMLLALEGASPHVKQSLIIDCISRVLFLDNRFNEEIGQIEEPLKGKLNKELEGALTLGEISNTKDGRINIYNKTTVTGLFYV